MNVIFDINSFLDCELDMYAFVSIILVVLGKGTNYRFDFTIGVLVVG